MCTPKILEALFLPILPVIARWWARNEGLCTQIKRYRHLNFFQYDCFLEVRVPRVKLPGGSVRLVGESRHRVAAIAERYVEPALEKADLSQVRRLTIDETSGARGHQYVTIAFDAERRAVIFVAETREAGAIEPLASDMAAHGGDPLAVEAVSIDMSPVHDRRKAQLPNRGSTCLLTHSEFTRAALLNKMPGHLEKRRLTQKLFVLHDSELGECREVFANRLSVPPRVRRNAAD
ncbi:MAG: transposase [Spirochaetaceae bacterium]